MLNIKEISKSKLLNILKKTKLKRHSCFFQSMQMNEKFQEKKCILGNEWMDIYKLVTVTFSNKGTNVSG